MKFWNKEHWFWRGLARSAWITCTWDWFMQFSGRGAEAVLTFSVIYSCARLLPQLHTPIALDNAVFVAQMIALDVGGLSLIKLAKQARADNNESGADLAMKVSIALITIMIANVVLSILQAIAPIPAQVVAICEGGLLVARAIMAVLYSHVIHSLRTVEQSQAAQVPAPAAPTIAIDEVLAAISARLDALQAAQVDAQKPLDLAPVIAQITTQVEARLLAALDAQIAQRVVVSPVEEIAQLEAPKSARNRAPKNVLTMRKSRTKETIIHRLLERDEHTSSYALAKAANCAESTARNIKKMWLEQRAKQEVI